MHSGEPIKKNLGNIDNDPIDAKVYPGDSIQNAINAVSSDGTVIVYPGLYKENLVVDKTLKVIRSNEGESAYAVIQAADPEKDVFHITANNVTISGFNITGSQNKSGIYCSGSDSNITGNKLSYNNYGVYLNDSNRNVLGNNEMNNNSFGIYLRNSNNNQLKNNDILGVGIFVGLDNSATGIYLEDSDKNKLISNTVSKLWDGVRLIKSSYNELNNNSILHNYFSLGLVNSNNNKVLNNTIVRRGYSYSVVLADSQNNTLKGNTGGLNTEITVVYDVLNSTNDALNSNNTLEGEILNAGEPRTI
ncbi:MAG: NosD domain-containing protein [Methanobacterium sp.]